MLAQTACKAALWKNVILKYIILWSLYVWSLMYTETFVQIIKLFLNNFLVSMSMTP